MKTIQEKIDSLRLSPCYFSPSSIMTLMGRTENIFPFYSDTTEYMIEKNEIYKIDSKDSFTPQLYVVKIKKLEDSESLYLKMKWDDTCSIEEKLGSKFKLYLTDLRIKDFLTNPSVKIKDHITQMEYDEVSIHGGWEHLKDMISTGCYTFMSESDSIFFYECSSFIRYVSRYSYEPEAISLRNKRNNILLSLGNLFYLNDFEKESNLRKELKKKIKGSSIEEDLNDGEIFIKKEIINEFLLKEIKNKKLLDYLNPIKNAIEKDLKTMKEKYSND